MILNPDFNNPTLARTAVFQDHGESVVVCINHGRSLSVVTTHGGARVDLFHSCSVVFGIYTSTITENLTAALAELIALVGKS